MADLNERIERAVEELTGNESLLEMLETDAAEEMLQWGKTMVVSLIRQTDGVDDNAANLALAARLKAIRQFMRSAGNWAAGKYADPQSRLPLREKLLDQWKVIQGEEAGLPPSEELDAILHQVDDKRYTQHQLILNLKDLLNESR